MTLKMYVWHDFARDYSKGLAFAIAESADDARDAITEVHGYRSDSLAERPTEYNLDTPMAACVSGGG